MTAAADIFEELRQDWPDVVGLPGRFLEHDGYVLSVVSMGLTFRWELARQHPDGGERFVCGSLASSAEDGWKWACAAYLSEVNDEAVA